MSERAFYYNVRTGAVEEVERKSQAKDLMGPYGTREEASAALATARARTEAWDAEDAEEG
ncbi:methionine aminopeptidase [Kineococcus glutinatus]|uniref:SPOR domain-containing protein n=1 Tax=Kineococcus glutinatus TaxID=1070872 RepID=A0ABP9I7F7_9ACTN